uniref:C2H2-type domain-containing protein n=1 Tax=Tetradesmus obliquus TaxID=3088 RepID=A0A383VWN9_TETOB|eukprot:jgi/Sobl393_1/11153/SZX74660.1
MVRGNAKIEAQKKAAKKQEQMKSAGSQLDARKAALKFTCPICRTPLTSYATTKAHYESKHPKETVPPQEQFDK